MLPHGTIYQKGRSKNSGIAHVAYSRTLKWLYKFIQVSGAGVIGFAILTFLFTFGPVIKQEARYAAKSASGQANEASRIVDHLAVAEAQRQEQVKKEATELGINPGFSLVIPKIDAKSNIVANVDPYDELGYKEILQKNIAHAKGTYFPGQGQRIYLFSHSTDTPENIVRYNAVFYLLRKLERGDIINVYFADERYDYEVQDKLIVPPSDISWLSGNIGREELVLQTCDPPGTTINRLMVTAKPIIRS